MSRLAYPYCVVPAGHAPPRGLRGVGNAPVRLLAARELAVWASPVDRAPATSVANIRAHNDVVQAAAAGEATPVPLRFGQCTPARELRRRLVREAAQWRERMQRLAGTTEFGLLLPGRPIAEPEEAPPQTGREYLARAADRYRRERSLDAAAAATAAALRRLVGSLALDESVVPVPGHAGAARIAHLVARDRADEYAALVHRFIAESADRLVLSGPLPPWTFAR